MTKIFLDTNIFLRYWMKDNHPQFAECQQLFEAIEFGSLTSYTSNVVISEIVFLLFKHYAKSHQFIFEHCAKLLLLRNLHLIEKSQTPQALMFYQKYRIKYGDCLIATQIPTKATLVTYDQEFRKLPDLRVATPGEIVKNLV